MFCCLLDRSLTSKLVTLLRRVDGVWGVVLRAPLPLVLRAPLLFDEVLDDLDQSEVQERRRHEGEFENIQQARRRGRDVE